MHPLVALGQQILWPACVALKVPLLLHRVRVGGCHGGAETWLLARADGATSGIPGPVCHRSLPDMVMPAMPFFAEPPGSVMGATADLCRCPIIARGVPFCSQLRAALCQARLTCTSYSLSSRSQKDRACCRLDITDAHAALSFSSAWHILGSLRDSSAWCGYRPKLSR